MDLSRLLAPTSSPTHSAVQVQHVRQETPTFETSLPPASDTALLPPSPPPGDSQGNSSQTPLPLNASVPNSSSPSSGDSQGHSSQICLPLDRNEPSDVPSSPASGTEPRPPIINDSTTRTFLPPGFVDSGGSTSFASHQPLKDVQPPRFRMARSKADSAQGSRKGINDAKAEKADRLAAGIADILRVRDESTQKLAEDLDIPIKTILSQVLYQTSYAKKRAPNIFNALVYVKGIEMNGDLSLGHRYTMKEIQAAVRKGLRDGTISDNDKEEAQIALAEACAVKATGSRSSNTAADADGRATVTNITEEIINLGARTGTMGIALLVKGHIHDSFTPTIIESGGSSAFFLDVLKINAVDVLAKFEQWVCAKDQVSKHPNSLQTMKSDCSALVTKKLRVATNRPKVKMNYTNYNKSIVIALHVQLLGWPQGVPFACPSNITTVDGAKRLCEALISGTCAWVSVSNAQLKEYEALEATTMKTRKARSDKGKPQQRILEEKKGGGRGRGEDDDQEGAEGDKDKGDGEDEDEDEDEDEMEARDEDDSETLGPEAPKKARGKDVALKPPVPKPVTLSTPVSHLAAPETTVLPTPIPCPADPVPTAQPAPISGPATPVPSATPTPISGPATPAHPCNDEENPPPLKKKRKECSDKGKKRPRNQGDGDKENPPPLTKRARKMPTSPGIQASKASKNTVMATGPRHRPGSDQSKRKNVAAQLPPGFQSCEFINEDEDADDGA